MSRNLAWVKDGFLDFGEVFYLVDSDYRTSAQGWARNDFTGPLDIYERRRGAGGGLQYAFRTADYASDAAAMQAAVDAMIDFRGDALLLTPGAYAPATAVSCDVPDMRILGPRCSAPQVARASITAGVDAALTVTAAADRIEMGFLKFVPLTAKNLFDVAAAVTGLHFHDYFYDARGITGSTGTIFLSAAGTTASDYKFERFVQITDAAQGPHIEVVGAASAWIIQDFDLFHGGGTTLAVALADFQGALTGCSIRRGRGSITGLASSAVTNLVKLAESGGDVSTLGITDYRAAIGFCAASGLIALNGAEAGETGVGAAYLDVVGGGAGGLGTTFTQ